MKFLRLVWPNVFRKRTRALLTIGSIVLVLVPIVVLSTLLRALGFTRAQVLGLVLGGTVLLALLGGLAGVVLSFTFSAAVIEGMRHSPAAMFAYNLRLHPSTVASAFAAVVGIGAVAGFGSAVRSAQVSIVEGLRKAA
jgi:putative ABC transport system permease protein